MARKSSGCSAWSSGSTATSACRTRRSCRRARRSSSGEIATWDSAEAQLKAALEQAGQAYTLNEGDGAFYGPKIDFDVTDAIGRKWQCATIQLDYQLPQRFDLKYIGADNAEHRPVVIHRAIFGSFERFIAMLIEHYAGAFPLWLAPVQAVVLPIADRHLDYAAVGATPSCRPPASGSSSTSARRRLDIRSGRPSCRRSPTCWSSGDREAAEGTVSVRTRTGGDQGASTVDGVHRDGRSDEDRGARVRQVTVRIGAAAHRPVVIASRKFSKEVVIAFDRGPRRDDRVRVNERIRVREIRVIDDTGQQLGIMPPPQALAIAKQKGLDLVEISPTAVPPVCRIMDFGKYQYQEQKRTREAKKHQKVIEVKEIKFRPKVDEHDYQFKKKHIERFLEDGDKVKATIFFRGREMAHPEIGRRILERLIEELSEVAIAESMPRLEGNQMHTILSRKPQGGGKSKAAPTPAR